MSELVDFHDLAPAQRDHAQAVYEEAFPSGLRAPFAELSCDGERCLALAESGTVHGLAVVRGLGATGAAFLRYFAVDATQRGRGRGATLWGLLRAHLVQAGFRVLYLDVEDAAEPGIDTAERAIRVRRIAFYSRLGAIQLPVDAYRPPHGEVRHAMRLLAADLTTARTAPAEPAWVADAVRSVYRHRYGLAEAEVAETLRRSGLSHPTA
jgi:ribosomal protein S18 acetylase RimI-like enzyme